LSLFFVHLFTFTLIHTISFGLHVSDSHIDFFVDQFCLLQSLEQSVCILCTLVVIDLMYFLYYLKICLFPIMHAATSE
jgi:hypothetical protein